jgi:hypothetical protein
MKTVILALIFLGLVLVNCKKQSKPESPPVWKNQFQESFQEYISTPDGDKQNNGTMYYDWTNKKYRVDRSSGEHDLWCGTVYPKEDTPCSHIVIEGKRYLYFPQKQECCYCCSDENGCGVLKPDWLKDAEFLGYESLDGKTQLEKWSLSGLSLNLYWATADKRIMSRLYQQSANDTQIWDTKTYKERIIHPEILSLPDICKLEQDCPSTSTCQLVKPHSSSLHFLEK